MVQVSPVLRKYEGEATVKFDEKYSLTGSFLLISKRNGHCSISFKIDMLNQARAFKDVFDRYWQFRSKDEEFIKGKLCGNTTNGAEIASDWVTIGLH